MMNKSLFTAAVLAMGAVSASSAQAKTPQPALAGQPAPRYVSMATLKKLQRAHDPRRLPIAIQPLIDGKSLKGQDRRDLITDPPLVRIKAETADAEAGGLADAALGEPAEEAAPAEAPAEVAITPTSTGSSMDGQRVAQAFPTTVRPATPRRAGRRSTMPQWVRYPLEFQLCGIGIGTKAVDKDRFNRIDRYGLFAIHGNPTAVVVPSPVGGITVTQQPPEVAGQFTENTDFLPNWAAAVTVELDNSHVEWLYRRDTYSMGFVVDRLGYVDAIVVAGVYSPIAQTQLEDPVHTIKLGDDLRKVMYRYGYPDNIETYLINAAAGIQVLPETGGAGGAGAGGAGAQPGAAPPAGGAPGAPGAGAGGAAGGAPAAAGAGGGATNQAFRTFELRYEQSYNVIFTIRNNRVVRMYIFGDPDFFNLQRRLALRKEYN